MTGGARCVGHGRSARAATGDRGPFGGRMPHHGPMKELAGRLTALDPDAGAAVRVIAYFDGLAESRAGVEALVRGAAVLAGCPARLVDPERRVHVRVEPDGTRRDTEAPPDPTWPSARLSPHGTAALWLERAGAARGTVPVPASRTGSASGAASAHAGGSAPGMVEADLGASAPGVGKADVGGPASGMGKADLRASAPGVVKADRCGSAPGATTADRAGAASQVADTDRGGVAAHVADIDRAGAASHATDTDHPRTAPHTTDTDHPGTAPHAVETERGGAAAYAEDIDRGGVTYGVAGTGRTGAAPDGVTADRARAASHPVDTDHAGAAARRGGGGHARVASSVVDAVILERAAGALRLVLDRTRGRVPADDPALVETLLDGTATEAARLHAARRLGLDPALPARALAPLNERPRVVPAGAEADGVVRLGVGPAVPVLELPRSWAEARTALRFTADGTPRDPGPRVVYAEELGGIALLADLVVPGAEPPPDVRALEAAAASTPWLAATLHAVASTASLRAAASEINVHHSTLQDRLAHAEHLLGWPVRTPQGRLRLQLALAMRHLARP